MNEHLFRYREVLYSSGIDEFGEALLPSRVKVELETFKIIKRTPKGAWIYRYGPHFPDLKRFVRLNARKKFACETKELAKESFIARKRAQIRILGHQINIAKRALNKIENRNADRRSVAHTIPALNLEQK